MKSDKTIKTPTQSVKSKPLLGSTSRDTYTREEIKIIEQFKRDQETLVREVKLKLKELYARIL